MERLYMKEQSLDEQDLIQSYHNPHRSDSFKRKPREAIAKEVSNWCETIQSTGSRITVREVRSQMKKGSHTTIAKYIKLWREQKADSRAFQVLSEAIELGMINPHKGIAKTKLKSQKENDTISEENYDIFESESDPYSWESKMNEGDSEELKYVDGRFI
jgi:hypothetical protein